MNKLQLLIHPTKYRCRYDANLICIEANPISIELLQWCIIVFFLPPSWRIARLAETDLALYRHFNTSRTWQDIRSSGAILKWFLWIYYTWFNIIIDCSVSEILYQPTDLVKIPFCRVSFQWLYFLNESNINPIFCPTLSSLPFL